MNFTTVAGASCYGLRRNMDNASFYIDSVPCSGKERTISFCQIDLEENKPLFHPYNVSVESILMHDDTEIVAYNENSMNSVTACLALCAEKSKSAMVHEDICACIDSKYNSCPNYIRLQQSLTCH